MESVTGLAQAEVALSAGDNERAFDLLHRAAADWASWGELHRFADSYLRAARRLGRQTEVMRWLEAIDMVAENRSAVLRAKVSVYRRLDVGRALDLADEALEATEQDEHDYAGVLAAVAFAAYRRGVTSDANRFAELAAAREFTEPAAQYDGVRAQLFAATARGALESMLNLGTKARAIARARDDRAGEARESGNLADTYLALGYPDEAMSLATAAKRLALEGGLQELAVHSMGFVALALAEQGHLDESIEMFESATSRHPILSVDLDANHAYWLLERNAATDAAVARELSLRALSLAERGGIEHRLMVLYGNLARAWHRERRTPEAEQALASARAAADKAPITAHSRLALAVAEITPADAPPRRAALGNARTRILREAAKREDPRAFCLHVQIHRRLLELSGGVPSDLPVSH